MKIFEVIEAKKMPKDEFDDEDDAPVQDADQDKIPHILMQMRKAVDVDGNYEFQFKNGDKKKLPMPAIVAFVKKYMTAKPQEKQMMQDAAIESLEGLMSVLKAEQPKEMPKIKGDRYMSNFAGDFDE